MGLILSIYKKQKQKKKKRLEYVIFFVIRVSIVVIDVI